MEQYTIHDVAKGLASVGYIPTPKIAMAAHAAITHNRPLLLEGAPGTGKTQLAKSVADMLGCDLIRVQFYEGLNADKLIYDYDYQRQLLTIQAISATLQDNLKGLSVQDALQAVSSIDFYSENFLIERPLLRSIRMDRPCVLLLDEVDKASEEIEYALLEFLEDYSLSIPQLGTVRCHPEARPIVFLTSNRYRDLSDALKRRCRYLYIPAKTKDEILAILQKQVQADQKLMEAVAADVAALYARRDLAFKQTPSIAEAIDWLEYLQDLLPDEQASFQDSLSALMKTSKDTDYVQSHHHTLLAATLKVWDHLHRITWPKAKDRVQQPEENTKDRNADKDRNLEG